MIPSTTTDADPITLQPVKLLITPLNALALLVIYYFLSAIYSLTLHPLAKVPGPFLAKITEAWRTYRYIRGNWHADTRALHRKYGKVVRIAPNEVSFVDEGALKIMYGHGRGVRKTRWYDVWKIPNMTISFFATTDPAVHRHLRSRVAGAYSMTSLLQMESLVQDVFDLNWARFGSMARSGDTVSLDTWVNYCTFDVVGQLTMGGMIGFLEQGRDVGGIIRSIHDGFWMMANMGNVPGQMWWFNNGFTKGLSKVLGIERLRAFDRFLEWLDGRVTERMRDGLQGRRRDMLQHFVEAKDEDKNPVKKGDVMIEGVNILGAGADATAIGILAVLGAVLTHPEYVKKLQEEIDAAYERLGLDESGAHIQYNDAQQLPLLSAIIKESTRLHPSIQYQLPRYVPSDGLQIQGHHIPQGTVCGMSPGSMNRSKEIFGDDADCFRPERWIAQNKEDEEYIKRANAMLTTFGMGNRSCVGRNLALIEMHKYVAQFFRQFNAELVGTGDPWRTQSSWFAFPKNLNVRLWVRNEHTLSVQA